MRHPAALASLCNQWRILQTSQPRSSAPSQLVTRSNLTHGKQAVVTNHIVLVPVLYRILRYLTLNWWLKERPSLNSTTSVGRCGFLLYISECFQPPSPITVSVTKKTLPPNWVSRNSVGQITRVPSSNSGSFQFTRQISAGPEKSGCLIV